MTPNRAASISLFVIYICLPFSMGHAQPIETQFKRILNGIQSGIRTTETFLIRDQESFNELWSRHFSIRSPIPPVPAVDFSRNMVVGLFRGQQKSGGYAVEITQVEIRDKSIIIHNVQTNPGTHCIVTSSITSPFDIILLPRSDLQHSVKTSQVVNTCM